MFSDADIIDRYTEEDAIADGVLYHPYADRWPWLLVTAGVQAICTDEDLDDRTYDQRLVPLLMDCIMEVRRRRNAEPPIVLRDTVCGTIWIMPNSKGGMTVMLPSEY